tara:strand:+ start:190 stop:678 length:489 start_codon:yes stop_codon:yes gene_type:complete
MKEIINKIINQSKFDIACFEGALILQGRILTPSEAQAAGLASGLLAASMANPAQFKEMETIAKNNDTENIDKLIELAQKIRPESIEAIGEAQDKIICRVIKKASSDNGVTWNNINLVHSVDQQDADKNRLWVGMIPEEDRKKILDRAMQGHKEAVEKIRRSL